VYDELATLRQWQADGSRIALASVIATSASAPRPAGTALAVHEDGRVVGSVSGGCVEGAVVEVATEVLATGRPQRVTYGISDDEAFAVGLTCGGTIEVFVRLAGALDVAAVADRVEHDDPVAVVTVVEHAGDEAAAGRHLVVTSEHVEGSTGDDDLDAAVAADARSMLDLGATGLRHLGPRGERRMDDVTVFVQSFAPRPRMIVFGAIDFASAVASMGHFLGYHVTVCDARARFTTPARFPDADEVVTEWPHRYLADTPVDDRTVICVLTHDPKFDVPVLEVALQTPARYIGVMGSRRTHEDRLERLRERGIDDEQLARLRSPIGLDLGGRTPQETAVAIAAEIVAEQHRGSGQPLHATAGPIHAPDPLQV
jgi:xanthine dehydrogenase accessory factor